MNNSVFRISLDIHRQTTQEHLAVKKGDTARKIIASLSDGGKPYRIDEGCYAVFRGKKPDGNVLYNNCTVENNCIVYEFTEQTAASAGYMTCEFQLYGADDQLITSPRFAIIVSGLVYDDSEVESSAEFTALSQAMTDLVELKANGLKGDAGPQGPMGPQGPKGESGVYLIGIDDNEGNEIDEDYDSILQKCESGQAVAVCLGTAYDRVTLPFVKENVGGELYFSTVCDGKEWQVIITRNPEDGSADVAVKTLSAADSPEMYFDITDDGVISLKPEYRGACPDENSTYGVSDNGVGVAGSKNNELPENIVIPDAVNEIAVTALPKGMFMGNTRVKRIKIPSFIKEIPALFAREAINLEEVSGTENVKVLNSNAFYMSGIKKASFPSVESLGTGKSHFMHCANLVTVELSNKITEIPYKMFQFCEKLSCIRNVENVTKIGQQAFLYARRLMNPPFLSNLTSIGVGGFSQSRVNYDWASLTNCTFGELATSLQLNPTDYWSGCTPKPCYTPLKSVFNQNDPRWADVEIGNLGYTYRLGCVTVSAAMVYSALANVNLTSPEEFVEAVYAENPDLITADPAYGTAAQRYLEAVGLTVEPKNYSAENLQTMYDALAGGALVVAVIHNGVDNNSAHVVVFHGVNAAGEVLVTDPGNYGYHLGVYQPLTYAIPIQNVTTPAFSFLIVTKN